MAAIPVINDFGWQSRVKAYLYASVRAGGHGDNAYPSFQAPRGVNVI